MIMRFNRKTHKYKEQRHFYQIVVGEKKRHIYILFLFVNLEKEVEIEKITKRKSLN